MATPQLINPIPPQVINELAGFHPFNLQSFFESDTPMRFSAEQIQQIANVIMKASLRLDQMVRPHINLSQHKVLFLH